jgi:methionyl-tRNA formyltransferase
VRIVFLGTPGAAVASLESLVAGGHEVPLVVTRQDRPLGRSGRPVAPPVKRAADRHGIPVFQPGRIKDGLLVGRLREVRPDLLVVVAYGRLLPRDVLEVAPAGAVNVHFSLLPKYRGAAPVQWALARGERTTGVTTMQIDERLDEGDLLLQRDLVIAEGEHAPALEARLAVAGAELLALTLERLQAGTLEPRPQDGAAASYAPLLSRRDGDVDPALDAAAIEGRVRGFDPWPGVWLACGDRRVRLVEAVRDAGRATDAPPGLVLGLEAEALVVACGSGSLLRVLRIQPEGRRVLLARDAVNGRQLRPGDQLTRIEVAA